MQAAARPFVVLVPGNGCAGSLRDLRASNFYGWAESALQAKGLDVRLRCMPDPLQARESAWVPFIVDTLCGGRTRDAVVVGHSSGAVAALRVAERHPLRGLVLVAAYDDDLGDAGERASGYFSRPFDWRAIVANCGFVAQFAGARDGLVPVAVQRRVAAALGEACAYTELPAGDHFFEPPFEELVGAVEAGLRRSAAPARGAGAG